MSKVLQLRGGTSVEHNSFIGASREVTVDTDKNTLIVHDGVTPGGYTLAKASDVDALNNNTVKTADINGLIDARIGTVAEFEASLV